MDLLSDDWLINWIDKATFRVFVIAVLGSSQKKTVSLISQQVSRQNVAVWVIFGALLKNREREES